MTTKPEFSTELHSVLQQQLTTGLQQLTIYSETLVTQLLAYLALLHRWNSTYNLTAIREPQQMVTRHILDSLAMHPYIHSGRLADLGTGPGLPGIPLALAKPELHVTLVESNGKKARFLREVVRQLSIPNADVAHTRAEAFLPEKPFDFITARALDTLQGIIKVGGHLLIKNGSLLAMKGIYPEQEIAALPKNWTLNTSYILNVPNLNEDRHLMVIDYLG